MILALDSISRPRFLFEESDDSGGGAAPAGDAKMGSSFANLLKTITPEDQRPAPAETEAPTPPPAKEKPAAEAKPAAENGIPDGVLESLTPKPKEEVKPDAEFESLTAKMTPKARENFQKQRDTYEAQVKELRSELETAKKAPATPPAELASLKEQLKKLTDERQELQTVVEKIALERSPAFNQKFVAARNTLMDRMMAKVEQAGGDQQAFAKAFTLTGKARWEAMEDALVDAPPILKTQVGGIVDSIDQLDAERDATLAKGRQALTNFEHEQVEKAKQNHEKLSAAQIERFATLVPTLADSVLLMREVAQGTPGGEQWNADRAEIIKKAQHLLFQEGNFDSFAASAIKSNAYDYLEPKFRNAHGRIRELEAQLKELKGAEPVTRNSSGGLDANGANGDQPSGFAARVMRDLNQSDAAA